MARFRAMPYAKALFEVVSQQAPDRLEAVVHELDRFVLALAEVPELLRSMVTPVLSHESKNALLDEVLDALELTRPARDFMHVLREHYRLEHLAAVRDTYRELVDRAMGRVRATIEVPAALAEAQRQAVVEAVSQVVDATVVADFVERPELLAGFRVQVGSKVFDASLIGQLQQLRRHTQMEQS